MDARPKQVIYGGLAEMAQAIGHPHRLELLVHLGQGARSVEDLAAVSHLSGANTSRHLQILRRARLVAAERLGKRVIYSLEGSQRVVALLRELGSLGERNRSEIRQVMADYFTARDALDPVTREELMRRLREGTVTLIDLRPEHEFDLGHVPGALNIPMSVLKRRLARLPRKHEIIAYCRGPYCVFSFDAVALLRAKGFRVRRLEDGFPEWKAAGLPVQAAVCA